MSLEQKEWTDHYYLRMMGLARRANIVILGVDRIIAALKKGFHGTIFLANDLGQSSQKKIIRLSEQIDNVYLININHDRTELGASQGLRSCAAIAVKEGTLEQTIRKAVQSAALNEEGG